MNSEFHPAALAEFENAAAYYAKQDPEAAERFVASVQSAVARILQLPRIGRIIDGDARRFLVQNFPDAVVYAIETDHILVIAVMHCHRDPGYWLDRVS